MKHSVFAGLFVDEQVPGGSERRVLDDIAGEVAMAYPRLHSSYCVNLWTSFEVFIKDLASMWVQDFPETLSERSLRRNVDVTVGGLLGLENMRSEAIWQACLRLSGQKGCAADRFSEMFEAIGLQGFALSKNDRDDLSELESVRHLIAHTGSRVDVAFKLRNPSPIRVSENVGEVFVVSEHRLERYRRAAKNFVKETMRICKASVPESHLLKIDGW